MITIAGVIVAERLCLIYFEKIVILCPFCLWSVLTLYCICTLYGCCIYCNSCSISSFPFTVVVGFTEEEYVFLETDDDVVIPVWRRGNLSIEISFYCLLQNVSQSNSSSATAGEDYHHSKILHTLSFSSGQMTSGCVLRIADDTLREGNQTLQAALVLAEDRSEQYVRFDVRSAIININDREDGECALS